MIENAQLYKNCLKNLKKNEAHEVSYECKPCFLLISFEISQKLQFTKI